MDNSTSQSERSENLQLAARRIAEAGAGHKLSRQRYKLKCKKQIRIGESGRTPSHSCTHRPSITRCKFITRTDLRRAGLETYTLRKRSRSRSETPKTSVRPPPLTGVHTDECHKRSVCKLYRWSFQGHWSLEWTGGGGTRSHQTIRRITFHRVTHSHLLHTHT